MGKVRKKRFRRRHDPTLEGAQLTFKERSLALPSHDLEVVVESENSKVPVAEKLNSDSEAERQWACHAVARLVVDAVSERKLVRPDLIARLIGLLEDPVWEVREASLGALRNVSEVGEGFHCEKLVRGNVMRPLVTLIKQCVEVVLKSDCPGEDMGPPFPTILDHSLNLLLNLSEATEVAVEAFNKESALHCLLQVSLTRHVPISLRTLAAQCLQIVTEDNPVAVQSITTSSDLLIFLERALTSYPDSSDTAMIRISLAGVLQNILSGLTDHSQAVRVIVDTLTNVLDVSPEHLVCSLSNLCTGDGGIVESDFAQLRDQLRCVQMALEVLANLCYIEDESEDDSEWEDMEEEMGGVMDDDETVAPNIPDLSVPQGLALNLLCDRQLHHKLLSWCVLRFPVMPSANQELLSKFHCIQECATVALLNMVTSLPDAEVLGGCKGLAEVWGIIFQGLLSKTGESHIPSCQEDRLVAYLGVIGELANKFNSARVYVPVSRDHEKCIESISQHPYQPAVRAAAVNALGRIGRMCLQADPAERAKALPVIASALCERVAGDPSLWVVCEALDAMFDILGSDDCPPDIVQSPIVLPLLKKVKNEFKSKFHQDKHSLKPHMGLVSTIRINLPKFIVYLENM